MTDLGYTLAIPLAVIGFYSIDRDPWAARRRELRKSMRGTGLIIPWRR